MSWRSIIPKSYLANQPLDENRNNIFDSLIIIYLKILTSLKSQLMPCSNLKNFCKVLNICKLYNNDVVYGFQKFRCMSSPCSHKVIGKFSLFFISTIQYIPCNIRVTKDY